MDIEEISIEEIMEALGPNDMDSHQIMKAGAAIFTGKGNMSERSIGRLLTQLGRNIQLLEEAHGGRPEPARAPARGSRSPTIVQPTGPGKMNQKAIDAGLPDNLQVRQKIAHACPTCGNAELELRATRDGKRTFLGCTKFRETGCKGSISYKDFS